MGGCSSDSLRYHRKHSATGVLLHLSRDRGGISVGALTLTPHTLQIRGAAFSHPKFEGWVFKSTVKQVFFDNPPPNLGGKFHPPNLGGVGCQGRFLSGQGGPQNSLRKSGRLASVQFRLSVWMVLRAGKSRPWTNASLGGNL